MRKPATISPCPIRLLIEIWHSLINCWRAGVLLVVRVVVGLLMGATGALGQGWVLESLGELTVLRNRIRRGRERFAGNGPLSGDRAW